ncbi:MAG: phenylalanine--tRNA ligase beta subunit [Candidatus Micrarchaeota archaeon]|nr:MAG: phenylalanine--tRNA ligase beta subunit [Candidatus Micrarchaeota archaeon]
MTKVLFYIEDILKEGVSREQIEDFTPAYGMEVKEMTDSYVDMDITPNRPDLFGFAGYMRALKHFYGMKKPDLDRYKVLSTDAYSIEVNPNTRALRPFIVGLVAKNLKLDDNRLRYLINFTDTLAESIGRSRRRVAIGVHDLDKIEWPLRYEAVNDATIKPLNLNKEVSLKELPEITEQGKRYGSIHKDKYLVLRDRSKVIAAIPIINSYYTKVTESTRSVFIDLNGDNLELLQSLAALVAAELIDYGAEIYSVRSTYKNRAIVSPVFERRSIRIKYTQIDKTLGHYVKVDETIDLLNKMGYSAYRYGNFVMCSIPPYRIDVIDNQDVLEDIAIALGYNNINPLEIKSSGSGLLSDETDLYNKITEIMIGYGFTQVMNTYLTNEKILFENMLRDTNRDNIIMVEEPKEGSFTTLRDTAIPQLLVSLKSSEGAKLPIKLFEVGKVFYKKNDTIYEEDVVAGVIESNKTNYIEIKAYVEGLMKLLGFNYKLRASKHSSFIDGRAADLLNESSEVVGVFGEIHPQVLLNFSLFEAVTAFEIKLFSKAIR